MRQAQRLVANFEYESDLVEVLALSASSGCSAYDCEFVSLARRLDVPLVTADAKVLSAFADVATTPERFAAA